jgi:tRNA pseudouridine38-40 synthase
MPTFKLTIAYDGTDFVGWQRQASGVSIQGLLEHALSALDGSEVSVMGAGRTDAGVHATGQVAGVSIKRAIDGRSLVSAANARLPETVRVLDAHEVDETFHVRFHARAKTYQYRIWNAEVLNPFGRRYAWHIPGPTLDIDAMAAAAALFEGRHDFAAMQAAGGEVQTTDRTVFSSSARLQSPTDPGRTDFVNLHGCGRPSILYEISGDGFLRHMVRNIVGTLVEVGRGRQRVEWVADVMASLDRGRAGPTAPAKGLFLIRVDY